MAVTPPPASLITREQLEARVSKTVLDRVLDDSGSGEADNDAVQQLLFDASSKVRGKIGPIVNLNELDPATASEVVRISLDVATAYLALRHPELLRRDGFKILELAEKELCDIRLGKADFGTESGPELQNHGVPVVTGNPDNPNCFPKRFSDGWGDF
jgi:hypothetical protein